MGSHLNHSGCAARTGFFFEMWTGSRFCRGAPGLGTFFGIPTAQLGQTTCSAFAMKLSHLVASLATLGVLLVAGDASAKDTKGKWGFGASLRTPQLAIPNAPQATIDGIYWAGRVGLIGRLGFAANSPDGGSTSIGAVGGVGAIYNFFQEERVNVGTGLEVDGQFFYGGGEADNALYQIGIGIPLRGEYFLSDHFAINASVGVGVDISIDPGFVSFGTDSSGVFGNAGFVWYLD